MDCSVVVLLLAERLNGLHLGWVLSGLHRIVTGGGVRAPAGSKLGDLTA